MALVEHLHDAEVLPAAFEDQFEVGAHVEVDVGHGGEQGLLDEGVNLFVHLAQTAGVVGVRAHALEAVKQ